MKARTSRTVALAAAGALAAGTAVVGLATPATAQGQSSPTPTATTAPTAPSATASPTASAAPTATAPQTSQPSPATSPAVGRPSQCTTPTTVELPASSVLVTRAAAVRVRATPSTVVRLHAASSPSTTYRVVRQAEIGADGTVTFRVVPPTTTQLFAEQVGCDPSETVVLGVRASLTLSAVREGPRAYRFEGRLMPGRFPTRVVLFRIDAGGREVLTATTTSGSDGVWRLRRAFLGSGRFDLVARTPATATNLPATSNVRPTLIF